MPDIGIHLGFDLQMTLKRKNNHFNVIGVPTLVKNEVLHQTLRLLFKKFKIQDGHFEFMRIKKYVPIPRVTPSFFLKSNTYTIRKSKDIL